MARLGRPSNVVMDGRRAQFQVLYLRSTIRDALRVEITRWLDSAPPANGGHVAGTVVLQLVSGNWERNPDTYVQIKSDVLTPAEAGTGVDPVLWLRRAHEMLAEAEAVK